MSEEMVSSGGLVDDKDARLWATLCHAAGLATFVGSSLLGIVAAVVIWMLKRDEHPFINEQGREAINFLITYSILYFVSFILMFVVIGIFLLPIVALAQLILGIVAIIKVYGGEHYRYPFIIRLV